MAFLENNQNNETNKGLSPRRQLGKARGLINDSISDMLTRIRNANLAKKSNVSIPYTKLNLEIAEILAREGFIQSFQISSSLAFTKETSKKMGQVSNNVEKSMPLPYLPNRALPVLLSGADAKIPEDNAIGIENNEELRLYRAAKKEEANSFDRLSQSSAKKNLSPLLLDEREETKNGFNNSIGDRNTLQNEITNLNTGFGRNI